MVHKTRQAAHHPSRELLHAIPVGYAIDGSHGIRDPRGMVGERLGVRVHLVSSERGPVANLETCIGRCHLDIAGHAASACAAALGCLVEDEMEMGVTVIDFGGGTTDLAMFMEGECVHVDSIPMGGQHITSDIAEALSTPAETAERIKTLHGSVVRFESDSHETIEIPLIGERDGVVRVVSHAELTAIIRPRVEHMLQMLKSRLGARGVCPPGRTPSGAHRRRIPIPGHGRTGGPPPRPPGPSGTSHLAQGSGQTNLGTRLHGLCRSAAVCGAGRRDGTQ